MVQLSNDSYDNSGDRLNASGSPIVPVQLSVAIFGCSESLVQSMREFLSSDRYKLTQLSKIAELFDFLAQYKHQIDCLVLQDNREVMPTINLLYDRGMLLPLVILQEGSLRSCLIERDRGEEEGSTFAVQVSSSEIPYCYHPAEVFLPVAQLSEMPLFIDRAIAEFLKLSPTYRLPEQLEIRDSKTEVINPPHLLRQQRRRLAEKLKNRLGYLAVYYKRNSQHFFRHLTSQDQANFLDTIKEDYCQILLNYFSNEDNLNQQIDELVTILFFADFSVSQLVEIHMELIDDFAHQLKLEGRNEEILLDYRLTLIDVIAHLCEMYRRAIPREL